MRLMFGMVGSAPPQRQAPLELAVPELAGPAGPSPAWALAALLSVSALALMAPVSALMAPTAPVLLKMPQLPLSQAAFVRRRTWQAALVAAPWTLSPWHDSWSPLQPWRQGHIADSNRSAFALVACLATG